MGRPRVVEAERSDLVGQCIMSGVGPESAIWLAAGLVKQVVLPGKHGVAASADTDAVKTACPPWNGGLPGSAEMVTGRVLWLPSHGNSSLGTKPPLTAEPWAIARPAACSTCRNMLSDTRVSDGSNAGHVTVTGSVIATRPVRLGAPRLMVIASAAGAVAAQASTIAVAGRSLRIVMRL